jgi:hypothetical protein
MPENLKSGEIKMFIGKKILGMSSVSLQYAHLINGALKSEASADTLSFMLQEIMRPNVSMEGGFFPIRRLICFKV